MIDWVNVHSSAIRKVGFNSATSTLYIDFEDSDPYYEYYNVPEHVFREFVNAQSVGRYYHRHIKKQYS